MVTDIRQNIINSSLPLVHKKSLCHILDLIDKYATPDLKYVITFGSCARGTMTIGSDIDLLLVFDQEKSIMEKADIRELIEDDEEVLVPVDLVFYTSEQFKTGTSYLTRAIKKEGILVWERI